MYKGVPVGGLEFFELLNESEEFCADLGRVVLAAGRLEVALAKVLEHDSPDEDLKFATLGQLIGHARSHDELRKMIPHLEMLKTQRNYLTHNIYSLLSDRIDETILERNDIIDSDVHTYTERAWVLKNNLNGLADIVERQLGKYA
jgi:hypothetical protein